jgi:hypothetical protein
MLLVMAAPCSAKLGELRLPLASRLPLAWHQQRTVLGFA